MSTKTIARFALALALSAGAGCAPIHITTPPGFAELDQGEGYRYRASNADGVVLAVRREKNDPEGDLAFWSGAVDAQLRRAGYQAVAAREIEAHGVKGRQVRYAVERDRRKQAYWVSVFVTEKKVYTVEAGGDAELFAREEKAVERAIASLDPS